MRLLKLFLSPWGRIDRSRFWIAIVVAALIVVLPFIGLVVFMVRTKAVELSASADTVVGAITIVVLLLASYLSTVASAKRFNDRGKSSWWVFIGFIPLAGLLWIFIELGCLPGTAGRNRYGPPRGAATADLSAVFDDKPMVFVEQKGRASNLVAILLAWIASIVLFVVEVFLLFQQRSL